MRPAPGMQLNLHAFRFCIGIGRKILNAGMGCTLGQFIFFVTNHSADLKTFRQTNARCTIGVDHVVSNSIILSAEDIDPYNVLPYISLIRYLGDQTFAIPSEHNNFIEGRAISNQFFFAQTCPHKTRLTVHIQLLAGQCNLIGLYGIKGPDFGLALPALPKLLQ